MLFPSLQAAVQRLQLSAEQAAHLGECGAEVGGQQPETATHMPHLRIATWGTLSEQVLLALPLWVL